MILDEKNFLTEIASNEKVLVFFYRESGCSFCDKMKPIVEELSKKEKELGFVVAKYALGAQPDSINAKYPINRFPTFYAFVKGEVVGKHEGALEAEQLPLVFTPELLPKHVPMTIEKASLLQLMTDEANLIDQIAPLRSHLAKIQKEIASRKKLAEGKIGSCCDSCADGGSCSGH